MRTVLQWSGVEWRSSSTSEAQLGRSRY